MTRPPEVQALAFVRRWLLAILAGGLVGTGAELLLLGHTEDAWQLAPVVLIVMAVVAIVWHVLHRGAASVRVLQATMLSFVACGAIGLALHYEGNVEFEREMYPSLSGWDLFRGAMTGATPALAPGTMTLLGLLGLVYTYRHPAVLASHDGESATSGEQT